MSIRKIRIAGRTLTVKANSEPAHFDSVVEELNDRIDQTRTFIPDSNESILFVALALTDELITAQNKLSELQGATQEKIYNLLGALETFENRHNTGG